MIVSSFRDIARPVPGLYDPKSERANEVTDFCVSRAIAPEAPDLLSDPATQIVVKDKNGKQQLVPLGRHVVSFTRMINNLAKGPQAKTEKPGSKSTPRPMEHVEQSAPAHSTFGRTKADQEFAELSTEDQERYLRGKE